jgi:lipoprotein-releasing system permease protein
LRTSLFIAKRIIAQNQPSFSGFIIKLATAACAVSVAAMIITISMVNGFQYEVAEKVYSFWGHTRVQALEPFRAMVAEETPMLASPAIEKMITNERGLKHVHAFAARSVVLRSKGQFEGVLLKGVDNRFVQSPFQRFIKEGKNIQFPDSGYSTDLLVSSALASQLEIKTGDTVSTIFMRNGEEIRSRKQVISGLFYTGIEEYDKNFVVADLRFLQRLNLWQPNEIGGYEIWLETPDLASNYSEQVTHNLPQGIVATPLANIYPNIFDWLAIQNQTKHIVIGVMLAVAIINLITCLLILVMERTRMVALLSAMGMPAEEQRNIFWYYTAYISLAGIGLGLLLGVGLLFLQQFTGFIKMDESTYYVDTVPVRIIWWQIAAIVGGTFAICLLALRFPLAFISRISVIKALRFN